MAECVQVAVSNATFHFDKLYSYSVPAHLQDRVFVGSMVLVPFGRGAAARMGVVLGLDAPEAAGKRLKSLYDAAPEQARLSEELLRLVYYLKEHTFCTYYEAVKAIIPYGAQYKAVNTGPVPQLQKQLVRHTEPVYRRTDAPWQGRRTEKQQAAWDALAFGPKTQKELEEQGVTKAVLAGLVKKGVLAVSAQDKSVALYENYSPAQETIALSPAQQAAYSRLAALMDTGRPAAALLHGVTSSGKTLVFLKLIEKAVAAGRKALVLVPEISLTPQMIYRLKAFFGDRVAVQHSALNHTERLLQWRMIQQGNADIVVGTRSAVFAPLQNLGLIIMDEEQEHTYQSESAPRFDAHDVAKKRAVMENALLLFASATPLTETYHAAESGKLQLVQLTHRYGGRPLPSVDFIDMRAELAAGNPREVSVRLARELQENLDNGEQSILLLNRRGYRTIGMCTTCGHVLKCPNCSVPLVYHKPQQALLCHHCGHTVHPLPQTCPECGGKISYSGFGTQRVEEELAELLPGARILRMDQDSTSRKDAHETMLAQFARHEYDILLGTQMVAKGLDFEKVTLVGVLGIDSLLFGQGFRAYESVFSLITQVVGRGGRAALPGRALIQTSVPDHPVLQLAAAQDYKGFYREEITFRRFSLYPPFCSFVVVGFIGDQEGAVFIAAQRFGALLGQHAAQKPNIPLRILGPAPMNITMLNNKFRYKLTLKCRNDAAFRALLHETLDAYDAEKLPQKASVILDFNSDGDL